MKKHILQIPIMVFSSVFIASMMTACGGSSSSPSTGGGSSSSPTDGSTTGGTNTGGNSYSGATKCAASKNSYKTSLYDDTYIVKASRNSSAPIQPNDSDIIETCGFGSACYIDDFKGDGHTPRNGGKAFCARTVLDKNSPYYNFGGTDQWPEWQRYPTKLEIDCRARFTTVFGSQENGGKGTLPADPNNTDVSKGGHPLGSIMNCAKPTGIDRFKWPIAYGKGPVFKDFNVGSKYWTGAEFNPKTREIFAIVNWSNNNNEDTSTIVAWNVDTKDRRVVSGIFPDTVTGEKNFGSGYLSPKKFNIATGVTQPMSGANTIRLAKDGYLYVSSEYEIIKVNQDTGKRELVWSRLSRTNAAPSKHGQCLRPSYLGEKIGLQLETRSFTVGPNGKFYKGFRDIKGGNGILEISKDATQCKVITRWGGKGDKAHGSSKPDVPVPTPIGSGYLSRNPNSPVFGMLAHAGKIYAVQQQSLVEVDPITGDRKRVDDPNNKYPIGYTSMYYDTNREVIWTSGMHSSLFGNVVVDPKTGQTEQLSNDQETRKRYPGKLIFKSVYEPYGASANGVRGGAVHNSNMSQYGGVIVDPKNPDIAYGVMATGSLIKYEISTYNNYHHSWGQH